ncbi:MAG: hypothetical protein QOE33_55 [Acidobacteriota bacterium]|nr:hypothetical protein [Acidobacteriota bacterium]
MTQARDYEALCFAIAPVLLLKSDQTQLDRRIETLESVLQKRQPSFWELLIESVRAQRLEVSRKNEKGAVVLLLILEWGLLKLSDN